MARSKQKDQHEDTFQSSYAPAVLQDIETMTAEERQAEIDRLAHIIYQLRFVVGKPLEIPSENENNG